MAAPAASVLKPLTLLLFAAVLVLVGWLVSLELALYLTAIAATLAVALWVFGRDLTLPPF